MCNTKMVSFPSWNVQLYLRILLASLFLTITLILTLSPLLVGQILINTGKWQIIFIAIHHETVIILTLNCCAISNAFVCNSAGSLPSCIANFGMLSLLSTYNVFTPKLEHLKSYWLHRKHFILIICSRKMTKWIVIFMIMLIGMDNSATTQTGYSVLYFFCLGSMWQCKGIHISFLVHVNLLNILYHIIIISDNH